MLVDTHAHLDFSDDVDGWIARAKEKGVSKIICVGTSVEASRQCVEIAQKHSSNDLQIYASVGIHAQDGREDIQKYGNPIGELEKIAKSSKKVIAVGECGFDFRDGTSDEEKKFQKEIFEAQIGLAAQLKVPLLVHCRNAFAETFELLGKSSGVFHSWTGDWEAAKRAIDLGFYISFSGIVTFKNAPNVQEAAKKMPIERMLLETDSPFLAPEPVRGSKNEPKNVRIVAEFVASLRNLSPEHIAQETSENAERLFGI